MNRRRFPVILCCLLVFTIIFAIFYGIAEALYWSTHDVMNIQIVDNENRKKYMTTKRILSKFINILVPIILGTSIELTSFGNIAIYIFVLTLFQIIMSLQIDTNKFVINDKIQKYSLKDYTTYLSNEQKENINKVYELAFLYGIMMDTIRVLVVVITIMTFKTSFNFGILTTIFSVFSMISLYLFNKLYQKKYAKRLLLFCATLVVLGVLGLILNLNKTTLIIYNFTYSITVYILEVMFKIKADDIVKEAENRIIAMIDEHEITKKAYDQKAQIIETANEMSREISKGTKEYADNLLGGTESVLTDTLSKLEQNMSEALNLMQISMEDTIKTIQNSRKELK